jgi:hypothetical protein
MKPGDLRLVSADGVVSLDERAPSDPADYPTHDFATHDDEFRAQQQKIERLNAYYDEVVAELLALLNRDDDEVH